MPDKKGWVRRAAERIAAMDFSELFCRERNRLVEAEGEQKRDTNRRAAREVERHIGEVICEEMNSGDPPVVSSDLTLEDRNRFRAANGLPPLATEELPDECKAQRYMLPPSHIGAVLIEGPPMTAADLEKLRRDMNEYVRGGVTIAPAEATVERVQRFRIMDAPDGCQYIVDISKQAEAEEWFRLEAEYWSTYDDGTDAEPPPLPSGMRVFNKDSLTFAFPEIKEG